MVMRSVQVAKHSERHLESELRRRLEFDSRKQAHAANLFDHVKPAKFFPQTPPHQLTTSGGALSRRSSSTSSVASPARIDRLFSLNVDE